MYCIYLYSKYFLFIHSHIANFFCLYRLYYFLCVQNASNSRPFMKDGERMFFEGSTVNRAQAIALTIAFSLRHQLTHAARKDLLQLLNVFVPDSVPRTNFLLDKLFSSEEKNIAERHMYCPDCLAYIGVSVSNNYCLECKRMITGEICNSLGSYMLILPIKQQLTDMLENHGVLSLLCKDVNTAGKISTPCDGVLYDTEFLSVPNNFSLSYSCDGVPVFKSSKYSIWPLFVSINELPLIQRRRHIILTALWFGPKKPRMDTFLKCFVDEMSKLYEDGLQWSDNGQKCVSKVIASVCICDAPARAMVQNFLQYNGFHGCGFCKHPGTRVPKGKMVMQLYYPVTDDIPSET